MFVGCVKRTYDVHLVSCGVLLLLMCFVSIDDALIYINLSLHGNVFHCLPFHSYFVETGCHTIAVFDIVKALKFH